jgi:hypothetical protein
MICKEEGLTDSFFLQLEDTGAGFFPGVHEMDEGSLANKDLVDVEENVTALNDHPLDGKVLSEILRLAHLVVHLTGKLLELGSGCFKALPFHVVVGRVGQELMESDDVAWDLLLGR